MAKKMADRGADVALDFGRLLGFKRVAAFAGDGRALASALGATCTKVGETTDGPATKLAGALGATFNKVGETG